MSDRHRTSEGWIERPKDMARGRNLKLFRRKTRDFSKFLRRITQDYLYVPQKRRMISPSEEQSSGSDG